MTYSKKFRNSSNKRFSSMRGKSLPQPVGSKNRLGPPGRFLGVGGDLDFSQGFYIRAQGLGKGGFDHR